MIDGFKAAFMEVELGVGRCGACSTGMEKRSHDIVAQGLGPLAKSSAWKL